jgi:hypothetical protein
MREKKTKKENKERDVKSHRIISDTAILMSAKIKITNCVS